MPNILRKVYFNRIHRASTEEISMQLAPLSLSFISPTADTYGFISHLCHQIYIYIYTHTHTHTHTHINKKQSEKPGLKQHSKNEDHGIWSHHFTGNRWRNKENNDRLLFLGAPKSLQMVTVAM